MNLYSRNRLNILWLFLMFTACGGGGDNGASDLNDTNIPEGAIYRQETLRRIYPPDNFTAVLGWFQAATLSQNQSKAETAFITIDYTKIIEKMSDGSENIILEDNYDNNQPYLIDGGLFPRTPQWFATNESTPLYNSDVEDGFLNLYVSETPEKILHWWTDRVYCDPNARYFVEVRAKIEGKVGLQIGSDYWVDLYSDYNGYDEDCIGVNNCEAWISDWYSDTDGEFIVIFAPLK